MPHASRTAINSDDGSTSRPKIYTRLSRETVQNCSHAEATVTTRPAALFSSVTRATCVVRTAHARST